LLCFRAQIFESLKSLVVSKVIMKAQRTPQKTAIFEKLADQRTCGGFSAFTITLEKAKISDSK